MRSAAIALSGLTALAAIAGCSKKPAEPAHANAQPAPAQATEAAPAASIVHGTRRLRNLDVPVFVDGAQVAVLRHGEMPPQLALAENPANGDHERRYYRLYEYLKAVGVDVDHVKAVHLAGTRDHVASLEGAELRAQKNRFVFDFQSGETGIAKIDWDTVGLKDVTRNDEIYALNVFVKKPVRAIDPAHHCYVDASDESHEACTPVVAWNGEMAKGTRIYVDGKMVAFVKRRNVGDGAIVGKWEDGEPKMSIDKYLASIGVDAAGAKAVDLLAGDDTVARATGAQWGADKDALVFRMMRHSHGKIRASVPAAIRAQDGDREVREVTVTAIQVYRTTTPAARTLTSIDDVVDVSALPSAPSDPQAALAGPGGHERDRE